MVIDTSVFIEHLRKKNKAESQLALLPNDALLFVSSVTVFELMMGVTDAQKQKDVDVLLSAVTILPFDQLASQKAADIYHSLRRRN
ncbi:hypothetical protein GCM10027275_05380 [Rhabdobacter roseus]|uniref:type II toxin-antitoxin system VapC family toxin n=1 Tax=Rhabdobacter roseus TaxID=1655419 RepID=UPI001FE2CBC3|nr:type II toxin-antitoxin system VapC family toxin [Rhabdobacter roseus]